MWDSLKYRSKSVLAHLLYYSGILFLIKSHRMKDSAVVLTYHRVLTRVQLSEQFSSPGIIVGRETFRNQIRFVTRVFKPVSSTEFAGILTSGSGFTGGECLITFDDGWLDNYTNAVPILREFACPALIFLPSSIFYGLNEFPREKLGRLLLHLYTEHPEKFRVFLEQQDVLELPPDNGKDLTKKMRSVVSTAEISSVIELLEKVTLFMGHYGIDSPAARHGNFLEQEHIEGMSGGMIDFGSHGDTHRILTDLERLEMIREVENSKTVLERNLNRSVADFAYPNGDFDQAVISGVKGSGYRAAFTTKKGLVKSGDDPFTIRRINIHEDMTSSIPMFFARILGVL